MAGTIFSIPIVGCLNRTSDDDEIDATDNSSGEDSEQTLYIAIRNDTKEPQTTHLIIEANTDAIVTETVEINPDERQLVDSNIEETGEYEITLTVHDGPQTAFTFEVDENTLSLGSNVDLIIDEKEIRGVIEE